MFFRAKFASRGQLFIAGVVGVLTGVYIYKPLYDQMRMEKPELFPVQENQESDEPKSELRKEE